VTKPAAMSLAIDRCQIAEKPEVEHGWPVLVRSR
jgi:hypothetical protein